MLPPVLRLAHAAMQIRSAAPDDIDALEELEFDCFDSDRFSRRRWRYLLTRARAITLVLENSAVAEDERLCGYAMLLLRQGSHRALLHSLCVHPRCQRQLLGTRLLLAIEQRAQREGARAVWLDVHVDNAPALALYRRAGYERTHWEANVYEDGGDAWRMEKLL